jgi:hypothetical protein
LLWIEIQSQQKELYNKQFEKFHKEQKEHKVVQDIRNKIYKLLGNIKNKKFSLLDVEKAKNVL